MIRLLLSFSLVAVAVFASACATVRPWERGTLSDPVMQGELIPETVFLEQHFLGTREASAGGYAIAGGGCGCN